MITEIVTFQIVETVSDEQFEKIVKQVETEFHMKQPGYIDSELAKGRNNSWAMVMHWKSLDEVKLASRLLMKDPLTQSFRDAIIPSSVKMSYLEQIESWSKI